jgi:hypothetical protein
VNRIYTHFFPPLHIQEIFDSSQQEKDHFLLADA